MGFRWLVVSDATLTERLRSISDWDAFIAAVVVSGAAHGFEFEPRDVERALREGQVAWLSQAVPIL
jgi:hypothetical protein